MRKFFDKLSEKLNDAAYEAHLEDFTCEFDAINKPAEMMVSVKLIGNTSNGLRSTHPCYSIDKIKIYDEDCHDVSSKYPNFCKKVKNCVPSYEAISEELKEDKMSPEEVYFGSRQGYLNYRFG